MPVDACLSLNRPRLLFYFECDADKSLVFFSAPHRSTCSIAPTGHDMTFRGEVGVSVRSPPVRGLIFCTFEPSKHFICNPATRQNLGLPQNGMLLWERDLIEFLIFGYDPVFDQFKVLRISGLGGPNTHQCWVITVGQDGNLWRKIQGIPSHLHPVTCNHTCGGSGICINGLLYFKAYSNTLGYDGRHVRTTHVVAFDLNSEKFSLIETNSHLSWFSKPVDFQGKLAFLSRVNDCRIEFCLMENKEWSSKHFHLPGQVYSSHYCTISNSVLGICDGEIVFELPSTLGFTNWHLSLEKKTTRKVDYEIPSNVRIIWFFFSLLFRKPR